ncbi:MULTISPECIES: PD-(D/E)XK nuclease family protein [Cysteiniphilum]|uniref:Endonuclease n=1 Tax=Cysteiniphilum litorale TaxID=2056700 RepID=A0A8J2Z4V6_9GAMM|nr:MULTISPECIES: PD-(D/E)XK nuclease family protein [Cysteiniphilum]GGF98300.1 endonuclease [Cysteiniphilum litorale]
MLDAYKQLNDDQGISHYLGLLNQIDDKTIVITANTRLKDHLTAMYLDYARNEQQYVVLRDFCMSFDGWTDALYTHAQMIDSALPNLISDDEARFLLLSFLKDDADVFMPNAQQAKLVLGAWQLLQQWNLDIKVLESETANKNVRLFLRWIERYQNTLIEHNWIDKSRLITALLAKHEVLAKTFAHLDYQKIILVGFDTLTPQMEAFFAHCVSKLNITIANWTLVNTKSKLQITEYLEDQLEIQKVAKAVFELSQSKPQATIGVIVPDLQTQFSTLIDAFDQYFIAAEIKQNPLLDNSSREYTISGGESLLYQGIVYQLMLWLKMSKTLSYDDIKLMLSSNYLKGHADYKAQRYQKLQSLKSKVPESIEFAKLVKLKLFTDDCDPILLEVITQMLRFHNSQKQEGKITAFAFIEKLKEALVILGYLDHCKLTSIEHQALAQFYKLLNKLIMLTRLEIKLEFNQWLIELQTLASNTLFQTETTTNPRVHILGMLEATEVYFDHLFVIRMNDSNWPSLANMNPYLPLSLQRSHSMPHSSVERELQFAKTITKRLTKQAQHIHFSYALLNNAKIQMCSPLVMSLAAIDYDHTKLDYKRNDEVHFDVFEDSSLQAMTIEACQTLKGGSQVFKNFAECPYRAALIHRLHLDADKAHKPILSALEKGVIIHHVLEQIWRELRTSGNLSNMPKDVLIQKVAQHVQSALNMHVALINMLPQLIKEVEILRLQEVIIQWLDYERSRQEPFEVLALEKELKCVIAGVTLKLRLDRIDLLKDNHTVVIDYKTSKSYQISDLLKSPITESQLPLYAIYENADAVAVATVNGAKIGLQSISSINDWIQEGEPKAYPAKKISEDAPQNYTALKHYWQRQLDEQMSGFVAGESMLTPSAASCQYCEFAIVCRMSYF